MKVKATTMGISSIDVPAGMYPRSKRPTEKDVQHLIGVDFPPIVTAQVKTAGEDGKTFVRTVLVDGAHRILAAELQGKTEISCEDMGLLEEADVLATAIALNAQHGKQLSMSDKARLAKQLIAENGVGEVAVLLSVGERTVSRWVAEAKEGNKLKDYAKAKKLIDAGASVTAAAKDVGVPRSTLKDWVANPPEKKEKQADLNPDWINPAETECPDRITALADLIVSDSKEIAKELEDSSWPEIVLAVVAKLQKALPKEWKE